MTADGNEQERNITLRADGVPVGMINTNKKRRILPTPAAKSDPIPLTNKQVREKLTLLASGIEQELDQKALAKAADFTSDAADLLSKGSALTRYLKKQNRGFLRNIRIPSFWKKPKP